jgi:hypothetical protein
MRVDPLGISTYPRTHDGLRFDTAAASAETIREEDVYGGVRVTLGGVLSRAVVRLHVDINVGDPVWPPPQQVRVPRLLGGELIVRGYPLEMVLAEKIVTAIARGTANTRWRDFADIYSLMLRHGVDSNTLRQSLLRVAGISQSNTCSPENSAGWLCGGCAAAMARMGEEATA